MRLKEAAASAIHLLVLLSYVAAGCILILFPSRPEWQQLFESALKQGGEPFYFAGILCWAVGCLFALGFFRIHRGRFLRVKMKHSIDVKVMRKAVEECFKRHFAGEIQGADVCIARKDRIDVAIELAPLAEGAQIELLQNIEQHLGRLFQEQFGYDKPFTVSVRKL